MSRPKLQWFLAAMLLINLCVVPFGFLSGSLTLKGNPLFILLLVAIPSVISLVSLYLFFVRKPLWLTNSAVLYFVQILYVTSEGRGFGFRYGLSLPFRFAGDAANGVFLNLLATVLFVLTLVAMRSVNGANAAPRVADA